ncbi:hypothetical protein [Acidiferrimicrobium sp. IK]|nr:hypothetical protein [Acidiferrimicrobium sp. IK]
MSASTKGRSGLRSTPAPRILHGLEAMRSSSTAVLRITRSSR